MPAFSGLGAPYWDMYARGAIVGLTRGVNRAHITRVGRAISWTRRQRTPSLSLSSIRVDGGATDNDILMKFQADILGTVDARL